MDKFDLKDSPEYLAAKQTADLALNVLGATGLINSIFSLWVWYTYLGDFTEHEINDFWYAWFGAFAVNGLLWAPLTIQWPIIPAAG